VTGENMKKLAISLILVGSAPIALASPAVNNPVNSNSYVNSLANGQAVSASGPQHIKNPSLFPNQQAGQTQQDGVDLNSSMFGMNGPLSLSSDYSSQYGFIMSGQYTKAFGQDNAGSLELDAGTKERRINGTWATAITDHQRLKFSAEYLQQAMDFNFLSGNVNKWVAQQAYGLSYQYLLDNKFISAINANSTYSTVKSQSLANKIMPNDADWINVRRIAGGTDKSFSGGASLTPFSTTKLDLALDYDELTYDIKYHNQYQQAKNVRGFGVTANLSQLITKHVKVQLGGSDRKIYDSYQAEIDYLAHTHPGSQLSFGLTAARTIGSAGLPNDTRMGLNVKYAWGGNTNADTAAYTASNPINSNANVQDDLAQWTATPAVHRAQVLAVADQELIANTNNSNAINTAALNSNTVIFPLGKSGSEQKSGNVSNVITVQPNLALNQKLTNMDLGSAMKGALFLDNLPTSSLVPDMAHSYYQSTTDKTDTGTLSNLGLKLTTTAKGDLALAGSPIKSGSFKIFVYAKDSASTPHSSFADKNDGAQVFTVTINVKQPSFSPSTMTAKDTATQYQAYSTDLNSFIVDPIKSDSSLQLIPTDKDGTVDKSAWVKTGAYNLASSSATQGSETAKITGTILQKTPVTLYAIAKNKFGQSGVATITINVSTSSAPQSITKTANVGDAWKNIDITSNFKQDFPAGDKVTYNTTSAFTRKAGGTSTPNFDISVGTDGQMTSKSSTIPASDEGQWVATVSATDGKITPPSATVTMNVMNPASFNKTPADQTVSPQQTTFAPVDLSQDLDPGYETSAAGTYSVTGLDGTNLKLDPKTGILSLPAGNSVGGNLGTQKVTVTYSQTINAQAHTTQTNFNLIIKPLVPTDNGSINGKHYVLANGSKTFVNGSPSIDFSKAFDNDNGATYKITGLPAGNFIFNSTTGMLQIPQGIGAAVTPNPAGAPYTVAVTATNAGGTSKPISVNLNVTGAMSNYGTSIEVKLVNNTKDPMTIQQTAVINLTNGIIIGGTPTLPPGTAGTFSMQATDSSDTLTQHELMFNVVAKGQTMPVKVYAPTLQEQCVSGVDGSCPLGFSPDSGLPAGTMPSQHGSENGYNFTTSTQLNGGEGMATITVS
jgi:hypothetical protein